MNQPISTRLFVRSSADDTNRIERLLDAGPTADVTVVAPVAVSSAPLCGAACSGTAPYGRMSAAGNWGHASLPNQRSVLTNRIWPHALTAGSKGLPPKVGPRS